MKKSTEILLTILLVSIIIKVRFYRIYQKGGEVMAIEKINLPTARKMANLTQKELAEKCGVSEATVFNWEKGKSYPNVKHAELICKAVGLSYDDIIFLA